MTTYGLREYNEVNKTKKLHLVFKFPEGCIPIINSIITATVEEFDENGIRFTMDDLANRMRVSKRTLYEHISSKEKLISEIIDLVFADIKNQQEQIVNDPAYDLNSKIKKIICLMPENFKAINYNKIYEIKKYYPNLYTQIDTHLAGGWEILMELLQSAIEQKVIRSVNVNFIRQIVLGIYRSLIDDEFLLVNKMTYTEALEEAVDIILRGLTVPIEK